MDFLAGLHPRIVHFPIALFILYFLFELLGAVSKKDSFSFTAFVLLVLGIISAIAAVLTGNQAATVAQAALNNNQSLKDSIELHQDYATAVLWFFLGVLVLRLYFVLKKKFDRKMKLVFIALSLIGCYLIYMAGSIGGDLVFKYGIGTQIFGK